MLVLTLVLSSAGLAGCAVGGPKGQDGGAKAVEAESEVPTARGLQDSAPIPTTEVKPPALAVRQFSVEGTWNLGGLSDRFAAFVGLGTTEFGDAPILILDLASGRSRVVRERGVNWRSGYGVLGLRCSDRWIVWEEVFGDEQKDPWNCRWKLYAARLAQDGSSAGEPLLVDESIVSIQQRPLFVVLGDEVYWMTNSAPNAYQEGAVRGARVRSKRLPDGATRTIIETKHNYQSISASEGLLLLTETVSKDSNALIFRVVDPSDGKLLRSVDLQNGEQQVAHFPKVHGSAIAWSILPDPESDRTLLLYRDAGTEGVLEADAIDPVFVGSHLFYEVLRVESSTNGTRREVQRIRGFDPQAKTCFTLLEADPGRDGMWQTWMAQGYEEKRLVLVNNSASSGGSPAGRTLVRVFELKQRRS